MKTKSKLFCVLVVIAIITSSISCKKDPFADPADKFVGTYQYKLTSTAIKTETGNFQIEKVSANKIRATTNEGFTYTTYTVKNNSITEESGNTRYLPKVYTESSSYSYDESSTGTLNGNQLVIDGTWSQVGYNTISFQIIATYGWGNSN